MFTSKQQLHDQFGVDADLAVFFVNRKVPEGNMYWKDRLLYVSGGTGYLFIPLFFDLQLKCGVSLAAILNEEYIKLSEAILHSAALYEREQLSFFQHLENCKNLVSGNIRNYRLYNDLLSYFGDQQLRPYKNLGTNSKALNRGDTLLFSICFLDLEEELSAMIIESWYALVPAFLLMDDISDLQEDREKNEENAVGDFGEGPKGVEKAIEFLRDKFCYLKTLNSALGFHFERSLERKLQTPYMQSLLKTNPNVS